MSKISRRDFLKYSLALAADFLLPKIEVPVLAYHDVSEKTDKFGYTVRPPEFRGHMETLWKEGYKPESLDNLVWGEFSTWEKKFIITFDDAYPGQMMVDNNGEIKGECAYGILKEIYGERANAAFFVCFDKNGFAFGPPEKEEYILNLILDEGSCIGHHTYSHRFLNKLGHREVEKEIKKADEKFEELLGPRAAAVKVFCYPGGGFPRDTSGMEMIRERFIGAVRTRRNYAVSPSPYPPGRYLFEIPRIGMYAGGRGEKAIKKIINGLYDPLSPAMPPHLRE